MPRCDVTREPPIRWRHWYEGDDGPLLNCPRCGADLTVPGALRLTMAEAISSPLYYVAGRLDGDGELFGDGVAEGNHCGTECDKCDENLADYEV